MRVDFPNDAERQINVDILKVPLSDTSLQGDIKYLVPIENPIWYKPGKE